MVRPHKSPIERRVFHAGLGDPTLGNVITLFGMFMCFWTDESMFCMSLLAHSELNPNIQRPWAMAL